MIIRHQSMPSYIKRFLLFARQMPLSNSQQLKSPAADALDTQFEAFFLRYERQITAYLCRMTGDQQIAFDLSQETFVRAWQHFSDLQDRATIKAWLYRVATNLAIRSYEHRQAHPNHILDEALPGDSDPGRRIVERDRVQHVLMSLTVKQRSALILHEVHGFTCDEIGHLLHLSGNAIRMALWRAREQFRIGYLREEEA